MWPSAVERLPVNLKAHYFETQDATLVKFFNYCRLRNNYRINLTQLPNYKLLTMNEEVANKIGLMDVEIGIHTKKQASILKQIQSLQAQEAKLQRELVSLRKNKLFPLIDERYELYNKHNPLNNQKKPL